MARPSPSNSRRRTPRLQASSMPSGWDSSRAMTSSRPSSDRSHDTQQLTATSAHPVPGRTPLTLDIFIPYWGEPRFMKETVQSVLAQDVGDWKLTVVDDAYPTLEVGLPSSPDRQVDR